MQKDYILINGTLYHHGIKGQKWGERRWQNEDGSLTPAGREHYGYGEARTKLYNAKQAYKQAKRESNKAYNKAYRYSSYHPLTQFTGKKAKAESNKRWEDFYDKNKQEEQARVALKKAKQEYKNSEEYKQAKDKAKKIAIAGAAVAATALAVYGGYKLYKLKVDKANTIIEGRKAYAKTLANSNRELYENISGYYQGKGYDNKANAPVNRLNDSYTKSLRKNMLRYQKNITEATKEYNEANKASKSSNLNKIKTAYKYLKDNGSNNNSYAYNRDLGIYKDYIKKDNDLRSLYKSDLYYAKNIIRRNNK